MSVWPKSVPPEVPPPCPGRFVALAGAELTAAQAAAVAALDRDGRGVVVAVADDRQREDITRLTRAYAGLRLPGGEEPTHPLVFEQIRRRDAVVRLVQAYRHLHEAYRRHPRRNGEQGRVGRHVRRCGMKVDQHDPG
jgi:hypothetical protein